MDATSVREVNYGADEAAMQVYLKDGETRALKLGNRGPVHYTSSGKLHPDIIEAYWQYGFYIFEGVYCDKELEDIKTDLRDILERLPIAKGATLDAKGRQAIGANCEAPTLFWSKPLADPFGGTDLANGRHPVKMLEPTPATDAPKEIVYLILGSLQFSDACLRAYGHPDLLAIAEGINGPDFTPFSDAIFIKEPGRGASVAWHQDGVTHWDAPDWDDGSHGFNFMMQLYGCTPANGLWVVPGSHKMGRVDIKELVARAGSERLPDAVPFVCGPGDLAITNRQCLHGSFANTSHDWRVTLNFGCHRRRSVLGVAGGGLHNAPTVYDETRIQKRSRIIGYAIDARRQRFPNEKSFQYAPFSENDNSYKWDEEAKASMKDYNLLDLSI